MNHNPFKFNLSQLCTWEQAKELAKILTDARIGSGISSVKGIYTPVFLPGPAAFEEPNFYNEITHEAEFHIHYRFNNGASGINAGLILDALARYPNAHPYVLEHLRAEVTAEAKTQ